MTFEDLLQSLGPSDQSSFMALGIIFLAGVLASAVCPCTVPVGLGVAGFDVAKA